jgi:zinc/manganese transport system substrate-binding protein
VKRLVVAPLLTTLLAMSACATAAPHAAADKLRVVAAEDVWGSIARQLGGPLTEVRSLVANPATDPHDYEPTAADARAVADADLIIVNGIGYDPWANRLTAANHKPRQSVLSVGDLVGLEAGANPHQWYSPTAVEQVIAAVTARYQVLDSDHASAYQRRRDEFESVALRPYHDAVAAIRRRHQGTPVGASESVFTPMAEALGLRLLTPPSFLNAVSEGVDPTAADKAAVDHQLQHREVRVFVENRQNATPDVARLVRAATANHIPMATVTETLTPRGATFQDWQTRQLDALQAALEAAA